MGWQPPHVYACTMAEFEAAWGGWCAVHAAPDESTGFATRDDLDDLLAWYADKYG